MMPFLKSHHARHKLTRLKVRAAQLAFLPFLVLAAPAEAAPVGLLALMEQDAQAPHLFQDAAVSPLGCDIRLTGRIGDESGDIDLEEPTHFAFLACDASVLSDTEKRSKLEDLVAGTSFRVFLEGDLMDFPDGKRDRSLPERQYILKVSHYNNKDLSARDQDLQEIGKLVAPSPDRYRNESFIAVNRALGMDRPDEAVVIFYDSPQQGKRFRDNNPEVLKKVGAFNDNHLTDYIYYFGKASR